MFGFTVLNKKAIENLRRDILKDVKSEMELIGEAMQKFTTEVVECLSNNFNGFASKLEGKPCRVHNKILNDLQEKYNNHEKRISDIESEIEKMKDERENNPGAAQ